MPSLKKHLSRSSMIPAPLFRCQPAVWILPGPLERCFENMPISLLTGYSIYGPVFTVPRRWLPMEWPEYTGCSYWETTDAFTKFWAQDAITYLAWVELKCGDIVNPLTMTSLVLLVAGSYIVALMFLPYHLPTGFVFPDDPSHMITSDAIQFLTFIRKYQEEAPNDVFKFQYWLITSGNANDKAIDSDESDNGSTGLFRYVIAIRHWQGFCQCSQHFQSLIACLEVDISKV
ncbi:hypothetical protein L210DRAFT_933852 [Boletus edulis BED1]|uniref:Uncharacterized protein n=1 Tax=Boletus edulis BED1 TaxID=1328754 RepID=A0AAD4G9Y6_BOLED|nr:hypothetical protein L210DRAFT_933852 [Boletus edulis BED1]